MTFRCSTFFAALAALTMLGALSGCGRKGPLELPPETQARGAALKALEAQNPKAHAAESNFADKAPRKKDPGIPGTSGHRPPEQYPFPLDPVL